MDKIKFLMISQEFIIPLLLVLLDRPKTFFELMMFIIPFILVFIGVYLFTYIVDRKFYPNNIVINNKVIIIDPNSLFPEPLVLTILIPFILKLPKKDLVTFKVIRSNIFNAFYRMGEFTIADTVFMSSNEKEIHAILSHEYTHHITFSTLQKILIPFGFWMWIQPHINRLVGFVLLFIFYRIVNYIVEIEADIGGCLLSDYYYEMLSHLPYSSCKDMLLYGTHPCTKIRLWIVKKCREKIKKNKTHN